MLGCYQQGRIAFLNELGGIGTFLLKCFVLTNVGDEHAR